MTVTQSVRDLVQRDADQPANAEAHIKGIAPRGENGLQAKACGDQGGKYEEVGEEDHALIVADSHPSERGIYWGEPMTYEL